MDEKYMKIALKEAKKAYKQGEVPVGAVIVKGDKILSKAHNMIEKKRDSTKHAEIIAINKASKKLKNWRLNGCDIYVTLEPCDMCLGAIFLSRIDNVIFAVSKSNENICKKKIKKIQMERYNNESLILIQKFFSNKRS